MKYLLVTILTVILSFNVVHSQMLEKSYEYILSSEESQDAKIIRKTDTEISIMWFESIPIRYFFNDKKEMYLMISLDSKFSAELDESAMHTSGKYELAKIDYIGLLPCRIYKRGNEFTGFYYEDEKCYMATAYSIELVLEAIRFSLLPK